ncbi:MAG: DUF433 domain-containing protein [Planctomycetes bacterium]|nr:DUF433 domain-containing protein [Planctomycetota bacterium]
MAKSESILKRIVSNPATFGGAPCVRDTRVKVESVLSLLAQGMSYDDLVQDFEISVEDIHACIAYAVLVIHGDTLESVEVQKT